MAKGNVFMGTLKGRVGDTVFYVKQGEQNAIKYQRNISNPQSAPQMYQRSRFLAANKFYTRGRQAFFKFAYENKRKGESDFNAFMRENIGEAPNITRDAYNFTNYPILGRFMVSRGSLPTMQCSLAGESWSVDMEIDYPSTPISTVADLSKLMIKSSIYEVGDIITLLFIQTNTSYGVPSLKPSAIPSSYGTPNWKIIQFKVDTLDITDLVDLGIWYERSVNDTLQLIGDEDTNYVPSSMYCGWTCVHSRPLKGKLKVSTQQILFNALASSANEAQRTDEIIAEVIADWRTPAEVPVQSEVVLKGSLVESTSAPSALEDFDYVTHVSGELFGVDDEDTLPIEGSINKDPSASVQSEVLFYIKPKQGVSIVDTDFSTNNIQGQPSLTVIIDGEGNAVVNLTIPANFRSNKKCALLYREELAATINVIIS